uniref:Uncharacterized protein n=1 Tax=Megaselia scalaris TaxID=36166 RepID=T1H2X2_MEGSC
MLDNEELISTLENTKTKASLVTEALKLSAETSKDIEKLRNGYRPAAKRGAVLFFALSDMATGSVALTKSERQCPAKWINEKSWEDIMKLSNDFPDTFGSLPDSITIKLAEWKEVCIGTLIIQ